METNLRVQAASIISFLKELRITAKLPKGIEVLDPYSDPKVLDLCSQFYYKYYDDTRPRTLLLGINPGRFGSGTTGVSFTDPIKLEKYCGIKNDLAKKPELSADFIYAMIDAYGGPKAFYSKYFVSAVSPLGFTFKGKNINYYDVPALEKAVTPFIVSSINKMIAMGVSNERCYCIGGDKNLKFLSKINNEHEWFKEIIPLPHPRFIMQYRRKKLNEYIDFYLTTLSS
ncbi:MAG TPA: uracil-DNA glycosylase family protein [Cyclobacteriaceae bacterium]|nr:uracil-DNA glycosylase family protein [Cyclobacteriaceae bacterium]